MGNVPPRQKSAEIINTATENINKLTSTPLNPDQVLATAQAQAQLATASALLAIADVIEVLREGNRIRGGYYTS